MPSQGLTKRKTMGACASPTNLLITGGSRKDAALHVTMSILLLGAIIEVHDKFQKQEVDKVLR